MPGPTLAKSAAGKLVGGLLDKITRVGRYALPGIRDAAGAVKISSGYEKMAMAYIGGWAMGGAPGGLMAAGAASKNVRKVVGGLTRIAMKNVFRPIVNRPGWTAMTVSTAAGLYGLTMGGMTVRPQGPPGLYSTGGGYMSFTSGRSGGMSPNHLGATGNLTLAMHRTRHKIPTNQVRM